MDDAAKLVESVYNSYNPDEISLSYNGGKDCTVLASLMDQVKRKLSITAPTKALYIQCASSFKEVDAFVDSSRSLFNLDIVTSHKSLKQALSDFLEQDKRIKVILIGTRSTDPNGKGLELMSYTDSDWPRILRVHPILHTNYHQIWQYLLDNDIPYCSLYDEGYTSLGDTHNTHPNPHLLKSKSDNDDNKSNIKDKYLPAHALNDEAFERSGRFSTL